MNTCIYPCDPDSVKLLWFLAVQNSSIGDLVIDSLTHWVTHWVTDFYFWHRNNDHDHDYDHDIRKHLRRLRHLTNLTILKQSYRLVTIETLVTMLTIENLNSWQSLLPDNQEWHWTAFAMQCNILIGAPTTQPCLKIKQLAKLKCDNYLHNCKPWIND